MHGPMNVKFVSINYYYSVSIETYSEESLKLVWHVCSHKTNISQNKNHRNAEINMCQNIRCHKRTEIQSNSK